LTSVRHDSLVSPFPQNLHSIFFCGTFFGPHTLQALLFKGFAPSLSRGRQTWSDIGLTLHYNFLFKGFCHDYDTFGAGSQTQPRQVVSTSAYSGWLHWYLRVSQPRLETQSQANTIDISYVGLFLYGTHIFIRCGPRTPSKPYNSPECARNTTRYIGLLP
jgi:hypothetical protein